MKIKKHSLYLVIIIFLSCNNYRKTDSGTEFRKIEKGNGRQVKLGDLLQLRYTFRNSSDSVIPGPSAVQDSILVEHKEGSFVMMAELFDELNEGDSVVVLFPADSIYKRILSPASTAAKNEKIKWNLRLVKIFSREEIQNIVDNKAKQKNVLEETMIRNYLLENNFEIQPTASGLIYIPLIEGKGKQPQTGDKVTVKYTARFLSGEIFDSSDKGAGDVTFVIGDRTMIRGWDEGITYMKEKGMARLVIPSRLAYSSKGFGPIPPDTPVIYDVELIGVTGKDSY